MPNVIEPNPKTDDIRVAIAVSRYNDSITGKLLQGAIETLQSRGVADELCLVDTGSSDGRSLNAVCMLASQARRSSTR